MTAFARRAQRIQPSAIREFLSLAGDPAITSFAGGYPDPTLFPMGELHKIYDDLLTPDNASALQYTASDGLPELRAQVAARLAADGMPCTADDVLITQGGQQGLDLTAKLFVDAGDVIVTERPTFLGALIAFNPCEPRYVTVPMDEEGMDINALERVLRTTERVKLIYTVPDFQNPTGRTLSLERRRRLIEARRGVRRRHPRGHALSRAALRGRAGAVDQEPRHDGPRRPPRQLLEDPRPRPRLGWALAAPEALEKLSLLKLAADTQNGTLNMRAAAAYLAGFDIERHIASMLPTYRSKRDLMLTAIAEHFPEGITWTRAQGGLFTWVTFPERLDAAAFQRDLLIPRAGVIVVPGAPFFAERPESHHARMSFSGIPDDRLVAGVRAMGGLLREVLS